MQNNGGYNVFGKWWLIPIRRFCSLISSGHGLFLFFSFLFLSVCLISCYYPQSHLKDKDLDSKTRDSLSYLYQRHYTLNTNLQVISDSIKIAALPVKDSYNMLRHGDRVVVAEFAIHPKDSVDTVWVKLAHTQDVQGWIREKELKRAFVPTDSISQFIYLFSDTHASYFVVVFALFIAAWIFRLFRQKQLKIVYFNDIDSAYPLLLCLLMAFSAMMYESIQVFIPGTWEHFYFNPTLSPFKVPFVLSVFLLSIWLFVVVLLAAMDDIFHQLSPEEAFFYLLGLASCCIFCYFFFILTTHIYLGYLFFAAFIWIFFKKIHTTLIYHYRCGQCGKRLKTKGKCPYCGAINE